MVELQLSIVVAEVDVEFRDIGLEPKTINRIFICFQMGDEKRNI